MKQPLRPIVGGRCHAGIYFEVDDCDEAVARAAGQGGAVTFPAEDVPGVGRFALLAAPAGASFAVIKSSAA